MFLCELIKGLLQERCILCELQTGTFSRHTAGARSNYRLDVFVLWPSPSTPVNVNKHARSRTRSHLFESPLHKFACHPTNSSHSLPGPLAEREVQQDRGSCTPNSLQYWFVCSVRSPPTTSSSSFLYFLLPFLPLSVSVSSSASLPYVTQKGPQYTDEGESGLWADRPERKQALRCTAIGAQHCQHMKLRINPKQTFGCSHSRNVTCMQRWMWHPKTIHLVNLLKSPKVSCTHRLLKAFLLFQHLSERLQDLQTQFILFVHQLLGVFD